MEVATLVNEITGATVVGDPTLGIERLAYHTRDVAPGTLFFCVPGIRFDGHDLAPAAVDKGAVALVCERRLDLAVTQIVVPSVRSAMAQMGARFAGDPSHELRIAAVTGTNGKTTTAHLISGIFSVAGLQPALLGTVVNRIGGVETPVTLTTAESIDLQMMFRAMLDAGDKSCAMEVSSHALSLGRTEAIDFNALVFTNLTRDHLDYHHDFEDYYQAKRRLFLPDEHRQGSAVAAVNIADEWGARLAGECRAAYGDDLWTYAVGDAGAGTAAAAAGSTAGAADGSAADVTATDLVLEADGTRFMLLVPRLGTQVEVRLRLAARFNVANALAAATAALAMGVSLQHVQAGLEATAGVAGRFEAVRAGQPFTVVVDYSHTPDSLENALLAARDVVASGRVLVVFGCGGDRDAGKRPLMGAIGARLADRAYVTSDNPRSEDPAAIISAILAGVPEDAAAHVVAEPDRRAAIALALADARADDIVVIAGKGHEQGQIIGDRKIPFDDRAVATELLSELGKVGA